MMVMDYKGTDSSESPYTTYHKIFSAMAAQASVSAYIMVLCISPTWLK